MWFEPKIEEAVFEGIPCKFVFFSSLLSIMVRFGLLRVELL